jgi:hypothetical protein
MKMNLYVDYWEDILLHLSKPLFVQGCTFLENFWPSSNWKLNYAKVEFPSTTLIVPKDLVIHPYCGPRNLMSILAYTLCKDLNNGDFFSWGLMILSLSLFGWE